MCRLDKYLKQSTSQHEHKYNYISISTQSPLK